MSGWRSLACAAVAVAVLVAIPMIFMPSTPSEVEASSTPSPSKADRLAEAYGSEEKGPRPEFPGEAAEYWAGLHQTRDGISPARLNLEAKAVLDARRAARKGAAPLVPNMKIEEWGPGNFGGRLRGIGINRTDTSQILVGSVSGGIWKSVDGGATWTPTDDFLETLAVGSMLVDPDDTDTVWVGTGEGFFNIDFARGIGIFQSTDFGDTWTLLPSTANSDFHYVNRIARIPGTDIVLAATRTGIHRSTDGGTMWTEVSGISPSSRGFTDLQIDPSLTTRLYAFHYGGSAATRRVYRSVDSGATWTELGAAEGIPTTNIGRMEIGVGTDGVVYLSVANGTDATNGLYRSVAPGNAFAKTASNTAFIERQGWYDLPIGVDPNDSDNVLVGAVDIFRTANAGTTITKETQWNAAGGENFVHADIHVLQYDPVAADTVYAGTDGGIFKSTDGGATWENLNNNLRITQYYGIATHPDGESVIGGTQDNGTHLFFGDQRVYLEWAGGDGGFCSWDQQQTNFMYGSTPGGGMYGSNNGGQSTVGLGVPAAGAAFIQPFTLDVNDGNRMIVGTSRIQFSSNVRALNGSSWTDVSGVLGTMSATTISPLDGEVAYAGTTAGQIHMTSALSTATPGSWTRIDQSIALGSDVTWIEVDPHDGTGDTLYATFADYAADRVWKSTNGGASWSSIHGNLPSIPVFSIRVDPTDASRLFLGTELGLFTTGDNTRGGTPSWEQYDYGTAFTRIMQLHWVGDDVLWAGTHGRGIYRIERSPVDVVADTDAPYITFGNTLSLPIKVTNRGGASVDGVTVEVSSANPLVSVGTGPQGFGDLVPDADATANFDIDLTDHGTCFDTVDLTVDVTWSGGGSATETVSLTVGVIPSYTTGTLTEDAEGPSTLFTSEADFGTDDWATVTTQANGGTRSWFSDDVGNFADKSLVSPWLDVQAGTTVLDFSLYYDMEGAPGQYWDGVVLEMRREGGQWEDIGNLSTVAYDGPLQNNNTAPSRDAWSGNQSTWRAATVDLGTTYNNDRVQFRFRVVCDTGTDGNGFWVDDISITNVRFVERLVCNVPLFADGFETGNFSAWTTTFPAP